MQNKFTPTVNIKRDLNKSFNYILTPNSERVFEQLDRDYGAGIHSFNIIGSFGTGKSSFLLAFEKQLLEGKKYFGYTPMSLNGSRKPQLINITGAYRPMNEAFSEALGFETPGKDFFAKFEKYYRTVQKEGGRLILVVDEFGKFLEYAAHNNPEKELYFLQQVSEFVNDVEREILLIATLHQNFQAYTTGLTIKQGREWEKVKGRFKEITFNEPIEQLLFLAAENLVQKNRQKARPDAAELNDALLKAAVFPLNKHLGGDWARRLLPFDLAAAAVLALSVQRYGQNERSLFSFLESDDISGLKHYNETSNPYYNISCVYDYLMQNFHSFLSTKYNPDYLQWSAIRSALERVESIIEGEYEEAAKLIKTIGLLNIFASKAGRINLEFLERYAALSLGIKDPDGILDLLERRKIILYRSFRHCYVLFEGTDLDVELAVKDAARHVELPGDIVPALKEYFQFPYIAANTAYFKTGTPRHFEVIFSNSPITNAPQGIVDGFINLVFPKSPDEITVRQISKENEDAVLYGLFQDTGRTRDILHEIEKVKYVISKNTEDTVAQAELKLILSHLSNELNREILGSLSTQKADLTWYFKGEEKTVQSKKDMNNLLTEICKSVYTDTPIYKSELINSHSLSTSIPTARKSLLYKLVENWREQDLGFPSKHYPPEKTIYLSLLHYTGIHRESEYDSMVLGSPSDETFKPLWETCESFLDSTKNNRQSLNVLFEMLSRKPFKLKQGFLEFWVPIFMFIKRDSFAMYFEDAYVPVIDADVLFSITKNPEKYALKAFDLGGIKFDLFNKYRILINRTAESNKEGVTTQTFVDTVRPFLTLYHNLPEYTKKTGRMSPTALALRDVIATAKDPEKIFFEDFPTALGYRLEQLAESTGNLETFIHDLREGIREIDGCYRSFLERIEASFKEHLGQKGLDFPGYKDEIQKRYRSLKKYSLLSHQLTFYTRLNSQLDDRYAWLGSLVQGVVGKTADSVEEREEDMICGRLSRMFDELDNLSHIAKEAPGLEGEEAVKIEVTTFAGGTKNKVIRLSREQREQSRDLEKEIKGLFKKNHNINISALANLMKGYLADD